MSGGPAWLPLTPVFILYGVQFVLPLVVVLITSVRVAEGPGRMSADFSFASFQTILSESYFRDLFLRSLALAVSTALFAVLVGYPIAYALARGPRWARPILIVMVLVPWLTNSVVRAFGWTVLFAKDSWASTIAGPLASETTGLMYTFLGLLIAMVHVLLPFMVFAIYGVVDRIQPSLEEVSQSLGAGRLLTFVRVTLPLSVGGIVAGMLLVFGTAVSNFVTPAMLGGKRFRVLSVEVYDQALHLLNWPIASALAIGLMVIAVLTAVLYSRLTQTLRGVA